jgi:hypothetical protein
MMPWTFIRERLNAIADGVLAIRDRVEDLRNFVTRPAPPPEPRPPFVCVLVEAEGLKFDGGSRGRITMGNAGYLERGEKTIELRSDIPLRNGRLIVFCDLERVIVHAIFLGVDLLTSTPGHCAVAAFEEWPVGVILRVNAAERKP